MRVLFANDEIGAAGGVQTYLEAVMQGLAARGHELAMVYCDAHNARSIASSLSSIPHFGVSASGLDRTLEEVARWSPDVCFSHNMRRLDVERRLLDALPVVKLMHGYFGTCIGGQKTFFLPMAEPCHRKFGAACLALYLPRRCGGMSLNRMVDEYHWARRQNQLFSDYAAVIVASQHMKQEYARSGMNEDKLHVNPLFPASWQPEDEMSWTTSDEPRVLFLGRMTKLKGGDVLIRAVAEASARLGRKIQLVLAGDGPQRTAWARLADKLQVSADFPGWVTREQQAKLLKETTLLAVPSVWPEPFGLVGLEAACFGVPAIAFDVGGVREWLRDGVNGYLAQGSVPTAQAFANRLVEALAQPERLIDMRRAARETAREMSLGKHLDRLETILSRASAGKS
ncbi:MAG TPA: glycosyltransferase family 4 protein [Pyrinomonadaceae bacterium]|jgi:glycosyltransferase involved in cell wall biosynthesis